MATKDITDLQVCKAYLLSQSQNFFADYFLMEMTNQCEKVCYRAMERAQNRGLIEYGVSLRSGWLTDKGKELINTIKESGNKHVNHGT